MACGFTLKPVGDEISTVKNFVSRMESSCTLNDSDLIKRIWVDMELPFKYVSQQLSDELKLLEPYGLGNSRPVFGGLNIKIISANIIGMKRNALKLYLEDKEGTRIEGIMFGNEESISGKYSEIRCAERINILFYPGINTYNGLMKPQIMIQSVIPK